MQAFSYENSYCESVFAFAHGYTTKDTNIFVPSLKLTFDSNFNVWETPELEIRPSSSTRYNEEALKDPEIKREAEEAKIREDAEVAAIRATVKEITIPENVGRLLVKLLELKKGKDKAIELLHTFKIFPTKDK